MTDVEESKPLINDQPHQPVGEGEIDIHEGEAAHDHESHVHMPSSGTGIIAAVSSSSSSSDSSDPNKKQSLNDVMNGMGNGRYQLGIGGLCGLAEASDGIQQLSVAFLVHHLGNLFHLTNQRKALVGSVSGAGMFIGATTWGRASDLWGRKYAFVGTLLMAGFFGMLSAAAPTYDIYLLFRTILCIGIGGNVPLNFTIFSEFSAKDNRGGYLTLLEACWSFGATVSCLVAWAVLPSHTWEMYVILVSLPAFLLGVAGIFLMPESPRFLLVSGDTKRAEEIVHSIAVTNKKPEYENAKLLPSEAKFEESSFAHLFDRELRTKTLTLFCLYFLLAFGCGIFTWLPVLLQDKKLELMSMYRSMVIMAFSQIPGVIFASYLVETVGRKYAISICFFMGGVTTALFASSESHDWVITTTILMEFFLAGANGSLSAFTAEVYPTTLRSTAMGACSSLSRLSSIVNPTIWALLLDVSDRTAVLAGSAAMFLGFLVIWFLPETKNQDIADHEKSA